ncbi:uncharacterized protein LOC125178803, partial [Hyalella azteca]|uniref:Uncharacterized protein LOC125178803 n=1 Tax=Hyalella azteca TaxID=294128 RepID=A0A979FTL7_HYAAZ
MPELLADTLHDQCLDHLDVLVQRVWDVTRYCRHSDPSVCAAAAVLVGKYLRAAALNSVTHECSFPPASPSLSPTRSGSPPSPPPAGETMTAAGMDGEEAGGAEKTPNVGEGSGEDVNSAYLDFNDPIIGAAPLLGLLREVLESSSAVAARGA